MQTFFSGHHAFLLTGPKTDPILNNYLTQTMENNARSGVRRVQTEMSFLFIFPGVVRIEKTYVVF